MAGPGLDPGIVPAIHAVPRCGPRRRRAFRRPVDGRHKAGHDGRGRRRLAKHETFLVGADGGADHFGRQVEERGLEFAHQHDRPFDEAGDLLQEAIILDELEPAGEGEVLGVGEDDRLAAVGVEHHLGLPQRVDVIVETADMDRPGRHETMAPGHIAGLDAVDLERDDLGSVVRNGERADDPAQGPDPAQRVGLRRRCAPAHRFRPRKRADDRGDDLGDRVLGFAARLLDHRDIELALLRVGRDRRILDSLEARALEKALDRRIRRADAGTFSLLAQIGLGGRQADDMQRQAPGGDEALRALIKEVALDQRVGDQALEVLRRLALHAGGDFFAEQFKQKVGHRMDLGKPRQRGTARRVRGSRPSPRNNGRRRDPPPLSSPTRGEDAQICWRRLRSTHAAPPPAVLSQAAPQALASSRTLRM